MLPDSRFVNLAPDFWAHARAISQQVGYTEPHSKRIRIPTLSQIVSALHKAGMSPARIWDDVSATVTDFGGTLLAYFDLRAHILNTYVEPRLMGVTEARECFTRLRETLNPTCPLPMNKQSGVKRDFAFFTGIINMLIEANAAGLTVDYDPRALTAFTASDDTPLRTLARRVDGAFPRAVNPIAVWEIKEYYYTTTFGSRVADGIYETLLDGMELQELRETTGRAIRHYLMVDDHYTWWESGRSYLCRIVDMLHMGYVDEALFGSEVLERLPVIVPEWVRAASGRATQ